MSTGIEIRPYGIPLDVLQLALEGGKMAVRREGAILIGHLGGVETRISVNQPEERETENGTIQAVITVRNELNPKLVELIHTPEQLSVFNPMTTIGALTCIDGHLTVGSRFTVYEEEDAWDLHARLILSSALSSGQTIMNSIRRVILREERGSSEDPQSAWTEDDLEQVRSYLSRVSVCTGGKGGLTAEFSIRNENVSAAQGDHFTALWRMNIDQPHPEGGGLFTLLEMPHRVGEERLSKVLDSLNRLEMSPLDLPSHLGAWCPGCLGDNPAYVTFLPNFLHDHPGIAVNLSFWAMARAQWANAMLASLGVSAGE